MYRENQSNTNIKQNYHVNLKMWKNDSNFL